MSPMSTNAKHRLPSLVECATALGGHDGYTNQERLEAIRRLQVAPAFEAWDKALIFSLSYPDDAIREAGLKACLARLDAFANSYAQSVFLRRLLDFCFHDLTKETLEARAQVFKEISIFLRKHKDELEPRFQALISQLLARAWEINFAHDQKDFADAVIRTQNEFSRGQRSDHKAAADLDFYRRVQAYRTLGIAESTLVAYLHVDNQFALDETFPVELFEVYNTLLHQQALNHAPKAHLAVFRNLSKWLSHLPQSLAQRIALTEDTARASKGVPWEELDFHLRLHLEAHQALLPGAEAPNDLLVLLKNKYTHKTEDAQMVLAKGLQTLRYLPGLRNRLPELCDYLKSDAMSGLGLHVWLAALELVESLLTGLSETELAPTTNAEGESISRKERREQRKRLRARQEALKHDGQLRDFLYTVATNKTYLPEVRQQAWSILLRTLPEQKEAYYNEGMTKADSFLFDPSLDMAGQTHQRFTWEFISHSWDALITPHQETEKRRERLQKVCQVLAILRPLQFVARYRNDEPPRLIALALDDQDAEVRRFATEAIHQAGFTKELEREEQRRTLSWLREEQTRIQKEIVRLEQQLKQLNAELTDCRIRRHTLTSQFEVGLLEREGIVTQGYLTNARLTIDLREVQLQLAAALQRAQREESVLHQLAQEIIEPLRRLQGVSDKIRSLVKEQEEKWEREINDLEGKFRRLNSQIRSDQKTLQNLEKMAGLQSKSNTDNQISSLKQNIRSAQSRLSGLSEQIEYAQSEVAKREQRIRNQQARGQTLRQQVDQLRERANTARRTLKQIKREVERLTKRANEIQREQEREHETQRRRLAENKARLSALRKQIRELERQEAQLRNKIIQTNDQLEHQMTEAQRVVQDIELGRQNYEKFSEQAKQDNRQADATAQAKQEHFEDQEREKQESLLFIGHRYQLALRQQQAARRRSQ